MGARSLAFVGRPFVRRFGEETRSSLAWSRRWFSLHSAQVLHVRGGDAAMLLLTSLAVIFSCCFISLPFSCGAAKKPPLSLRESAAAAGAAVLSHTGNRNNHQRSAQNGDTPLCRPKCQQNRHTIVVRVAVEEFWYG